MQTVLLVHPTMSEEFVFATVKQRGYKIFSIITSLETTHINIPLIRQHSDAVFVGSDSPEEEYVL